MESKIENLFRQSKNQKKETVLEYETVKKALEFLKNENKFLRQNAWTDYEAEVLQPYLFITSKPTIYLVNISVKDYRWFIFIFNFLNFQQLFLGAERAFNVTFRVIKGQLFILYLAHVRPAQISIWTNPNRRWDHSPTTMGESSGSQGDPR